MRTNRCSTSPHANQPLLEFTTCEPIDARVHHMRTNRCTGRKRTNAQPNTRTRLPSNSLRCKVLVAQAGGEWSELRCRREREAAHENPELAVNREDVTSLHGNNATFQQWIAPFANLPRVLIPAISGEQRSFLNTKVAALHDDFMSTSCCSLRGKKIPIRS